MLSFNSDVVTFTIYTLRIALWIQILDYLLTFYNSSFLFYLQGIFSDGLRECHSTEPSTH